MSNEFYMVEINEEELVFFKDKDKGFNYLWQKYLNAWGDASDEELAASKREMYEYYEIFGFGRLYTCGFED